MLKQLVPQEEGILKEMYDPVTFSVLIDSRNLLIKVHLEEALAPGLNPLLPEAKEISKAIQDYFNKHARKREVFLTISDYEQETNTFLGTITLKQQSLQQLLVA